MDLFLLTKPVLPDLRIPQPTAGNGDGSAKDNRHESDRTEEVATAP
ncbi:MAG: hypothetical protein QGG14_05430 [Planctomycetota bacterium]|jgi:hypothetical protein|nr:hypothetical protein [Planctomycetota bacterium]